MNTGKLVGSLEAKLGTGLEFKNPDILPAPPGLHSHVVCVPNNADLVYLSGQVGITRDGYCPATIGEQADIIFANIVAALGACDLSVLDIVKLSTFMVAGQDGNEVRKARLKYLGEHRPASTAIYVSRLVDPAWYVEVDVVAARIRAQN